MDKNEDIWNPLPREEVIKAVERKNPSRIPLIMARWWGEGLHEQYGDRLREFRRFPEDAGMLWIMPIDYGQRGLSWDIRPGSARDSSCIIDDWAKLDEFIDKMPDPEKDPIFDSLVEQAEIFRSRNLYVMFAFWRLFFERPWAIRGMQNIMLDYYTAPEDVHRLHAALCQLYCSYIRRAAREIKPVSYIP